MPPIATLRDNFTDNSESPAWGASFTLGSATKAETGGQAVFTLPSSTAGTHQAFYRSAAAYDLTGDSFYINIGTMVATGVAASAFFDLFADANNALRWTQTSGTLKAQTIVAGVATDLYSVAWSAATYKYLRIRESGGNVLFDSSTNGTSWTNRASVAAPFAVTALFVQFGATCGNVASPGSFRLDDVNLILPALSSTWRWTESERPYLYRLGSVTISTTSGQGYLSTAEELDSSGNLVSPRYFSGPIGSASGGYLALTEYTVLADAQAMAVNLPSNGRWDLPGYVQASVVRLNHRSTTGSTYRIDEFYPRRLVQSDDIEAESITAINIAANSITADKITTLTLTGKSIQTATSGARAVLSGDTFGGFIGYGASDTYDPITGIGTYQALWSKNDGKLYAGTGNLILDSNGLRLNAPTVGTYDATRSVTWYNASNVAIASIMASFQSGLNWLQLTANYASSQKGHIYLLADGNTDGSFAYVGNRALGSAVELGAAIAAFRITDTTYGFSLYATQPDLDNYTNSIFRIQPNGNTTITGSLTATVTDAATTTDTTVLTLGHNTSGTPGVNFGTTLLMTGESTTTPDRSIAALVSRWATATDASRKGRLDFFVYDTAARFAMRLETNGTAPMIGFLGAAAVSRPTVSGSRATDTWRQSVMAALVNLGLVTDSSTV
jgi:hypothetical protein